MGDTARKPDRILIVLLGAIAVLVAVALAVVFMRGEPEPLDENSAAGVVQRYSAAVMDGDTAAADSYLTERAKTQCTGKFGGMPRPARVVLVSTTERAESATVTVSIVQSDDGGPFGPSEFESEDSFSLLKVDGTWKVESAPFTLISCTGTPTRP
ncbi:hypothetical protein [Arthrobacter sp. B6]|uniref:hypothetical protein n=1 Tax=Arthrobacter sp. B6 TaxID=1570137 RepID=UPI00082BA61C|nr:hypothetical protein [Arthrobacter sp. B6]